MFVGTYCFECWGARSGSNRSLSGLGGYVAGNLDLTAQQLFFLCLGQAGKDTQTSSTPTQDLYPQTWNGGGGATQGDNAGGASDIRLTMSNTSEWSDITSLRSRIIVAGGGGGGDVSGNNGCHAGGLEGYGSADGKGGKQDAGGSGTPSGSFGVGGHDLTVDAGGGGGGWYGGGHGVNGTAGGGGSSFISGHSGCKAIDSSGNSISSANHFSGFVFTNTKMIDGAGYAWTSSKGSLEAMPNPTTHSSNYSSGTGHNGAGYARITFKPYDQEDIVCFSSKELQVLSFKPFYAYIVASLQCQLSTHDNRK